MKQMKKQLLLAATAALSLFSMRADAQSCRGTLVVNEISNGTSGGREFVELIAAPSSFCASQTLVDVSGWIIDDNNGVFNGGATQGVGISSGHLRLDPNAAIWKNVTRGTLIVLFNSAAVDSASNTGNTLFNNFQSAITAANGVYVTPGGDAIYVAVGLSTLVQSNNSIPTASPVNGNYCGSGSYNNIGTWTPIALRDTCQGDGIQTRCPGCVSGLGEPDFFHGFSYGSQMSHVTNGVAGRLDGANFQFAGGDTVCGKGLSFYLNTATGQYEAGGDAFWSVKSAATATPGVFNSEENELLIAAIAGGDYKYTACDTPVAEPVLPKGVLVLTEVSNGPSTGTTSGECEYVVMAVAPCSANPGADSVDVRGWILDDNNGIFNNNTCGSSRGIGTGHFRLADNSTWAKVPVGSSIVIYNSGDNCYSLPATPSNAPDANGIYWEPVGGTATVPSPVNANIQRYGSYPTSTICATYCNPTGTTTYVNAGAWSSTVGLANGGDAFQVRCPGCSDINAGTPSFYQGFGYGTSPLFAAVAATSSSLGGAVKTISSGSNTRFYYVAPGTVTAASLGASANWTNGTAYVSGSAGTIGQLPASLKTYLQGTPTDFPCCGTTSSFARRNAVGGNVVADNNISVYPNPAGQILNIEFPAAEKVSVKLVDMNGRTVASQNVENGTKVSFDVRGFAPGFYLYQVITNNGVQSGKVMIGE